MVINMMKDINYDEILNRIGFFMNKSNLSARAISLKLGYSEQFIQRILSKQVELKVSTLLQIFEILDITPHDFFYLGKDYNKEDKNVLDMFNHLSGESKQTIINLIKQMK